MIINKFICIIFLTVVLKQHSNKDTVVIQRQVVLFNCVNFNFMYYTH